MFRTAFFSILLTLLISTNVTAQGPGVLIRGRVVDSASHVLEGATVRLYKDSVAIRQARVTARGFAFARIGTGRYVLKAGFTGYRDARMQVVITGRDSTLTLPDLAMLPGVDTSLLEVVVKATLPPVMMKKDTVVYNAGAYKLRPNANIEELLKKLPGIVVDKDGGITLNGKKVEKIYLDGKEFLLNDPKLITQGFNADMLAAVEAFDDNSREGQLMGLKDMNAGSALNFRLKKQFRKSTVGKVFAGVGQDLSRYTAGVSADRIRPGSWMSASINTNSINGIYTGHESLVSAIPAGNNHNTNARFSYSQERFNIAYSGQQQTTDELTRRNRTSFLQDSTLEQSGTSSSTRNNKSHQLNMRWSLRIDSLNMLEFSPSLAYNKTESANSDTAAVISKGADFEHALSQSSAMNSSTQENWTARGSISYRHRFRKRGQYLLVNLRGGRNASTQNGALNNHLVSTVLKQDLLQRSHSENPADNYGMSVSYSQPVGKGKVVDLNYSADRNQQNRDKESFNYNPSTGLFDLPDTTTSNSIRSGSVYHRAAIGYNYASQKLRYQLGTAVQLGRLENVVYRGAGQSFDQQVTNWYPRASLQWQAAPGKTLDLNYTGQSQQPTVQQLQPVPDLTNPPLIRTGNPDLRPQFDHAVRISFNRFNTRKRTGFMASLNLHVASQKLVAATRNLPGGVQEIHYENLDGSYDISGMFSTTATFGDAGTMRLGTSLQYGSEPSFLNGDLVTRERVAFHPDLSVDYSPLERLNIDLTGSMDLSQLSYSTGQRGLNQLQQQYSIAARYELPGGWQLFTDLHYQQQVSGAGLPVQDNRLWNAAITKNIFSDNSGQLRLAGYDLLRSAKGIGQTISDQSIETTQTTVPGQLFLVSVVWNWRNL